MPRRPLAWLPLLALAACGSEGPRSEFPLDDPSPAEPPAAPAPQQPSALFDAGIESGPTCENLACRQVLCDDGATTTLTGIVRDPAGREPLYGVAVYVPNATPEPLADRATCDRCGDLYTGAPLVSAITGPDGSFRLTNVPAGNDVPLVLQIGKWRRQITVPHVGSCTNNVMLDPDLLRLPRNRAEGDLPRIAVSTGGADSLECLLRRIGVDDAEFGSSGGAERVHVYQGTDGHALAGGSPRSAQALWTDVASLSRYDMVLLSCEGDEHAETKPGSALGALAEYAASGGRVFASHFHYYWLSHGPDPLPATASWYPGANPIGDVAGEVDTSFPKGQAFASWLALTGALDANGRLPIVEAKFNATVDPEKNPGVQPWIRDPDPQTPATEYFTFNTPLRASSDEQCGRVVYSDLHVGAASHDFATSDAIPSGCATGDLTPQEKALEFMLFDLSACVQPDGQAPVAPVPTVH